MFDLELFQGIKFQISGKLRCGEVYSVSELKILGMNNYQLLHLNIKLRVLEESFAHPAPPPLPNPTQPSPDLITKCTTHPYTNLVVRVREYSKQLMWQYLAAERKSAGHQVTLFGRY